MAKKESFNPFGLVDEETLKSLRGERAAGQFAAAQAGLQTGVARGSHAIGYAAGRGARALATRLGVMKDQQMEDAKAVSRAQRRADVEYRGLDEDLKSKDPYEQAIQRRKILIAELEAEGQQNAAAAVSEQLIALEDSRLKHRKLAGEVAEQDLDIEAKKEELTRLRDGLREKDEITRLMNLYQTIDPNDPEQAWKRDNISARLDKLTTITGATEWDDMIADKITVRKMEDSIRETTDTIDDLMMLRERYNPEYLTLKGKVKNWGFRLADIAGLDLDPATKAQIQDFAVFRQQTSMLVNAYIKQVTGAQMSEAEAKRLKLDVAGMDDSPAQFKAKLEYTLDSLAAARERSISALSHVDDRGKLLREAITPLDGWIELGRIATGRSSIVDEATAALEWLDIQAQEGGLLSPPQP